MTSDKTFSRRRLLALTAATGSSLAIAGCSALDPNDGSGNGTQTKSETATGTSTPTTSGNQTTTQNGTETTTDEASDMKQSKWAITEYSLQVNDKRENGYPVWIDKNGRIYGRYQHEVRVSDDWYQTTELLYAFPDVDTVNDGYVQQIVVPPNGNIIVAVGGRGKRGSRIYRLNKDLNGATKLFEFEDGRVLNSMNHVVYGDIIVMGSYMKSVYKADRYGNEVILSTDGGDSFERILEVPLNTKDATNLHVHDVEYDPYAKRIWVVVGDGGNSQVYWSNDLGKSWETIAEQGKVTMFTQVAAFKDCVVFGTDGYPEGIVRWEREGKNDAPDGVDDLVRPHVQIKTDSPGKPMEMYARHRWHIREDDGRELCLMPFGYSRMDQEEANQSVVLGSVDGDEWYELFRTETQDTLLTNVLGPLSMDGNRRTLVSDSTQSPGQQFDATVPKFWN